MYRITNLIKKVKEYSIVIEILSLTRTISVVGITAIIILQDIWTDVQPCLHKIQDIIDSCIHSIL